MCLHLYLYEPFCVYVHMMYMMRKPYFYDQYCPKNHNIVDADKTNGVRLK